MAASPNKIGKILIVADERLSRERSKLLARLITLLKQVADLDLAPGNITEDELLIRLREKPYALVLAPWYRYLAWSRVEAFYGLTRTSGPTFAGYYCEPLLPYEIGETADHLRAILLDFSTPSATEIIRFIMTLVVDTRRTGLLPLVEQGTPIYYENWYSSQGLGLKLDAVTSLPEVALTNFSQRGNSIRVCLNALWSLVYEEGPGKGDFSRHVGTSMPKAYFQVACDRRLLLLRLIYSMSNWSPKDALNAFWPRPRRVCAPAQLIHSHSDFLRVHWIAENNDLELTVGFLGAQDNESTLDHVHSLWIEPVTANIITEIPFEVTSPNAPHLKPLPAPATPQSPSKARTAGSGDADSERLLIEAAIRIRELKKQVSDRDEQIRELKSGGVGMLAPLPPPDMESLLDAFRERILDAGFQLKSLDDELLALDQMPPGPHRAKEIQRVKNRMNTLLRRQQAWMKKIGDILEALREVNRQAEGA